MRERERATKQAPFQIPLFLKKKQSCRKRREREGGEREKRERREETRKRERERKRGEEKNFECHLKGIPHGSVPRARKHDTKRKKKKGETHQRSKARMSVHARRKKERKKKKKKREREREIASMLCLEQQESTMPQQNTYARNNEILREHSSEPASVSRVAHN